MNMDEITPETHVLLQEKFPFLTIVTYLNQQHIGIIQNSDNHFINLYAMPPGCDLEAKSKFLKCGETWWWESNRTIPINLFLRVEFAPFKSWLKTFAKKETTIVEGPTVNMMDLINRKLKRRTIQLVKSVS